MKIVFLLLVTTSAVFSAHGLPPAFLQTSPGSFFQALQEESNHRALGLRCQEEMKEKMFPVSCVGFVRKNLLKFQDPEDWGVAWDHLSSRCARSSFVQTSPAILRRLLRETALSVRCHQKLKSRLLDLEYVAQKRGVAEKLAPILNSLWP